MDCCSGVEDRDVDDDVDDSIFSPELVNFKIHVLSVLSFESRSRISHHTRGELVVL